MSRRKLPKPTDAELRILGALWRVGPSSVRELQDALGGGAEIGYTTVLKNLQIMTGKGLVKRDATQRPQVYRPACSKEETQRQLVGGLLDRAFGGSAAALVQRALAAKRVSPEELQAIRDLLDRIEQDRTGEDGG